MYDVAYNVRRTKDTGQRFKVSEKFEFVVVTYSRHP